MEVPHLNDWYRRYGKEGLVVLGLSEAKAEDQKKAAKGFGLTYPLFFGKRDNLPPLLRKVTGYPTTLLLDRNGKIREVVFGILFGEKRAEFERKLVGVLKEKGKAVSSVSHKGEK